MSNQKNLILRLLPGNIGANIVYFVIGILLIAFTFVFYVKKGDAFMASFIGAVGTSLFLAGFVGIVNTYILSNEISKITQQPFEDLGFIAKVRGSGLHDIYSQRNKCRDTLIRELRAEKNKIIMVGSSLRGLIGASTSGINQMKSDILSSLEHGVEILLLLTHPTIAHHRCKQEGRRDGDIEYEILLNIIELLKIKHSSKKDSNLMDIRLYNGAPTIFLFATSNAMIFNPYPYYSAANNSFSFLVRGNSELYNSYVSNHFQRAWEDADLATQLPHDKNEAKEDVRKIIESKIEPEGRYDRNIIPETDKKNSLLKLLSKL